MTSINILRISPDRRSIDVAIETDPLDTFTKVLFWTEDTFKDYSQAADISSLLTGTTYTEVFTIQLADIGIQSFDGIYFLEFTSTNIAPIDPNCTICFNPMLAVIADLSVYKEILLQKVLSLSESYDKIFKNDICNDPYANNIMNTQILLDSILSALQFGYYGEALNLLKSLKKIVDISSCSTCGNFENSTFTQGLNFSILNNTLILN